MHNATGINILQQLRELSQKTDIYFQWIPSHGSEIADGLAKEGSKAITPEIEQLTFTEIHSKFKMKIKKWKLPPQHSWYKEKNLGDYQNATTTKRTDSYSKT
mgnify:CR=1 FL=1